MRNGHPLLACALELVPFGEVSVLAFLRLPGRPGALTPHARAPPHSLGRLPTLPVVASPHYDSSFHHCLCRHGLPSPFRSQRRTSRLPSPMIAPDRRADELSLVHRCLDGHPDAWDTFYDRFHPLLFHHVARLVRGTGRAELVEEVVSRVWCALLARDRLRLRLFDPERGCLSTFLCIIARQQVQQLYRSGFFDPPRETLLPATDPADRAAPWSSLQLLREQFLPLLSDQERCYFDEYLMAPPGTVPSRSFSDIYQRKLKQRIRDKLLKYLGLD